MKLESLEGRKLLIEDEHGTWFLTIEEVAPDAVRGADLLVMGRAQFIHNASPEVLIGKFKEMVNEASPPN